MTKEYKKSPSQPLIELIKRTGMKHVEIAEVLGVSDSAVGKAVSSGEMPAIWTLAVEALRRRSATPEEETVVVAVISGGRVIDSRAVTQVNRMNLNGQTYMLIPTKT